MEIDLNKLDNNNYLRILLDVSRQGVKRLFVLTFDNYDNGGKNVKRDNHKKYFLFSRAKITKYNVLIDGRNFYDQPGDQIKEI